MSVKTVRFSKLADRVLQRMQPKRRTAIVEKIKAYARGERVDIKKMKGSRYFRIRVGPDRVIIDEQGNVIFVVDAGPRGGIYKE